MRKPELVERLYLDFDGFFASCEQAAHPKLRGRPVGVVPFAGTDRTCIIACSREAKLLGISNVMPVRDAKRICPDIILVPQTPDLYRRAHNALICEIETVIPIDAVKSIDELTCRIEPADRDDPRPLGQRIKRRLRDEIGPYITCSIGMAANRQLAKMACKAGKRPAKGAYGDGLAIWQPADMPAPLLPIKLDDIPGVGKRLARRLLLAGIVEMADLLATAPKQLRALWGNVTGERLWYALHGYDIQTPPSGRGMYGHGRVLPPEHRTIDKARAASRLLLTKAARRMRRDGYNAGRLWLYLAIPEYPFSAAGWLPAVHDDVAVLAALDALWAEAHESVSPRARIIQVHVTLLDLTLSTERQIDMLVDDEPARLKWEAVTAAIDTLNARAGKTLVHVGEWDPPGEYAGGKISYTRIPSAEDFW